MSAKFFDPSITSIEVGSMDGDTWRTAYPLHTFIAKYITSDRANPGDDYFIGTDPQRVQDFYRVYPYALTRSTTQNDVTQGIAFNFGSWGAFNGQWLSQHAWKFVGGRDEPHTREGDDGDTLYELSVDHYTFRGLRAKNYKNVFEAQNTITGLRFYDGYAENVATFLYPLSPSSVSFHDLVLDNIHLVNASVGLVLLGQGSTDVTIRNFSVTNDTNEDGEFRGINIADNCSSILIEDGFLRGGIDTWIGQEPKDGYGVFTQGDGLSIEETNIDNSSHPYFKGFTVIVRRVSVCDMSDRGIDIKPKSLIEDCSIINTKRGLTMWGDGSIARRCIVKSPRRSGNNSGICFLISGDNQTLDNCEGSAGGFEFEAIVLIAERVTLTVDGGEYTSMLGRSAFKFSKSGATLILKNVTINGVLYNETVVSSASNQSFPTT